jgi:NAD(P)-dependent dehydrogenase (short-subunit alcohol dehydrogenase family)
MQSSPKPRKKQVKKDTGAVPPKGPSVTRTYENPVVPDFTPKEDRICVLTGASGLLGTAFIKRCSIDYKIVAIHNSHDLKPPQKLVDPLYTSFPIENPPVDAMRADLSKPEVIDQLCADIITKYGKVDLLINAACHRNWQHMLADNALDELEESFAVNVLAPMRLSVGFAKKFWETQPYERNVEQNRNIINLSSTAGSYVYPDSNQTVYSATKAALNYATYHMANEFWDIGVRVNSIAPNTFPAIVATERVLDTIEALDQSNETGRLVLIDRT